MTFRVEDLTVSLLPFSHDPVEMGECTKCTKCTAKTGGPTACSEPSEEGCNQCCENDTCGKASNNNPRPKKSELDLAELRAQLDEFLASIG